MATQSNGSSNAFNCLNNFSQLKRFRKIFIGNEPDARDCDYLEPAVVLHNWPSQWHSRFPKGYIQLRVIRNKQYVNFDIAANSINGKEIYIFLGQTGIERLCSEKEIATEKQTTTEYAQFLIAEGKKQQKLGNWYGAAIEYQEAIQLSPSDAEAHSLLGYALIKLAKYEEAIFILNQGISLTSDRKLLARLYDARGLARSSSGDSERARSDFREAIRRNPRNPRILVHAGITEERAEQSDMAYTYALQALHRNPAYPPALQLKERLEKNGGVKPLRVNIEGLAA